MRFWALQEFLHPSKNKSSCTEGVRAEHPDPKPYTLNPKSPNPVQKPDAKFHGSGYWPMVPQGGSKNWGRGEGPLSRTV